MRLFVIYTILLLSFGAVDAQQKYWIYFKDQIVASGAETSSSINLSYLKAENVKPIVKSEWLNAITAHLDKDQKKRLLQFDFVKEIVPVDRRLRVMSISDVEEASYSRVLRQIEADTLVDLKLNGEGVKIGIIDGGFLRADESRYLEKTIKEGNVSGYKNFIEQDIQDPYVGREAHQDDHGTQVWYAIGGKDNRNLYRGVATGAQYYLARTDQGDKEYRGEEDYWVAALEWMHDQGVKLVNSSVGYSTGYDDPEQNYSRQQVDGKSSAITQAATIAANEKGMLIVIAAGNDGNNRFELISVPADAEGVLSVGATSYYSWAKASYSSIGPADLEEIKPEVSCYSTSGTSFSAPVITGVAACIWQAYPELTNKEIIEYIEKSSHLFAAPNNYLGYGVPNVKRLFRIIEEAAVTNNYNELHPDKNLIDIDLPKNDNIVAFHKSNESVVIEQEVLRSRKNILTVRRYNNAKRTTVASPDRVIEIYWEN